MNKGVSPSGPGYSAKPEPVVSALRVSIPNAGSTIVPGDLRGLLYEIWRIAGDYDLREGITNACSEGHLDSLIWRDCMEVLGVILNIEAKERMDV